LNKITSLTDSVRNRN